jgi:hypothetical protein
MRRRTLGKTLLQFSYVERPPHCAKKLPPEVTNLLIYTPQIRKQENIAKSAWEKFKGSTAATKEFGRVTLFVGFDSCDTRK